MVLDKLLVGLRPKTVYAAVGEPFQVTCSVDNSEDSADSSMLQFCIQYPNSSVVLADDYAHVVNNFSAQLEYTLHEPKRGATFTNVICFLKNSSSPNCNWRNRKTISTVMSGCKYRLLFTQQIDQNICDKLEDLWNNFFVVVSQNLPII